MLKLRVSQINGCAYCIDMHSLDARAAGETEQRLYALDAWRETPFYTDRERAATGMGGIDYPCFRDHVPDGDFDEVKAHFSDQEIVDLTFVASTINAWNRLAVPLRSVPGPLSSGEADRIAQATLGSPALSCAITTAGDGGASNSGRDDRRQSGDHPTVALVERPAAVDEGVEADHRTPW
jgi:AhpD family alkylhydroperoxidase